MTNEELNTALYKKMFGEQEQYCKWLLSQPAEEILKYTYEYTTRQNILCSLEYNDLTDKQAVALLKSPTPLADIYSKWETWEMSHMEDIWCVVEYRVNEIIHKGLNKSKYAESR